MLHCVFGIIWYRFVVSIFLYSVDFGIKWYRKWALLYLALPAIRVEVQPVCKWRVLKVSRVFFIFSFRYHVIPRRFDFSFDTKRTFLFSYDTGSKLTCDSIFFSRVVFFGRFITVEGDRIIWQAMQDKALSTKRANCLYYRDLRVDKRAFLWTKCPRKF